MFEKLLPVLEALNTPDMIAAVHRRGALYRAVFDRGGKLVFCGNGGSAALCQHVAAEYVGRYQRVSRRPLPAVALTADSATITALANDFGYDQVFARQVTALVNPDDLLIVHSTSGNSTNVLVAQHAARVRGARVAALLGRDGGLLARRLSADECLIVPSYDTARIQEMHLFIEHELCGLVERE